MEGAGARVQRRCDAGGRRRSSRSAARAGTPHGSSEARQVGGVPIVSAMDGGARCAAGGTTPMLATWTGDDNELTGIADDAIDDTARNGRRQDHVQRESPGAHSSPSPSTQNAGEPQKRGNASAAKICEHKRLTLDAIWRETSSIRI